MAAISNRISSSFFDHQQVVDAIRFGKVLLPFLSFYKPISQPISIIKKSIKTVTVGSQLYRSGKDHLPLHLLQTSLAIVVLIGTLFAHPIKKGITRGQSMTVDTKNLFHHLRQGDKQQAAENCANIIKNSLYFGILLSGSFEMIFADFVLKTVLRLYHSQSEFQEGNHLEAAGYLAMAVAKIGKQVLSR